MSFFGNSIFGFAFMFAGFLPALQLSYVESMLNGFTEGEMHRFTFFAGGKAEHYRTLGIETGSDHKTVKNAFRTLAQRWHPDRNGSPEAEDKFKAILAAYVALTETK